MNAKIENGNYLNRYFTQFPNIIDDSKLSPFEFRLLIHYYRVGECWEGVRTTAEKCSMSTGKVAETRKSLEAKGFITIDEKGDGVTIRVVDKAEENVQKYCPSHEHAVHTTNINRSPHEQTRPPHEHKKNQLRITNEEIDPLDNSKKIIDAMNEVKQRYSLRGEVRWTKGRAKEIEARLREWKGSDPVKEITKMIEHKAKNWKGTEFEKFIRVETLFRASKFFGYMEEAEAAPDKGWEEKAVSNTESAPPTYGNIW